MHAIGIRRDVYEKNPWLAVNIYQAFSQAKQITQAELFETAALRVGLPWVVSSALSAQEVLGPDIFSIRRKIQLEDFAGGHPVFDGTAHRGARNLRRRNVSCGHDGRSET